jgi:hypothetical protein
VGIGGSFLRRKELADAGILPVVAEMTRSSQRLSQRTVKVPIAS